LTNDNALGESEMYRYRSRSDNVCRSLSVLFPASPVGSGSDYLMRLPEQKRIAAFSKSTCMVDGCALCSKHLVHVFVLGRGFMQTGGVSYGVSFYVIYHDMAYRGVDYQSFESCIHTEDHHKRATAEPSQNHQKHVRRYEQRPSRCAASPNGDGSCEAHGRCPSEGRAAHTLCRMVVRYGKTESNRWQCVLTYIKAAHS